jgi:hypothetical protein
MQDNSKTQWQERPRAPTIKRNMTKDEIEEFRKALVLSAKCNNGDITSKIEVMNEKDDYGDPDIKDYVKLVYRQQCVFQDKPQNRVIYTIKIPIPDNVKARMNAVKRSPAQITL